MKVNFKSSNFSDYLKPSQIVFNLKSNDKVQSLNELLDILLEQKIIKNKELVLTRIINREKLESTAIGHGVALPHARVNTGNDIAVVVGRSKEGIDFDAIDKKKVHLVILMVWNPSLPGLFNHLFAGLAQYLRNEEFREKLFKAKDKSELYSYLSEIVLSISPQDKIISRANLIKKLQEIEISKKKATPEQREKLDKEAKLIRGELDAAILDRFDKLMEKYGYAVAEVVDGVCRGCNINVATGISSSIEGSNDIYICENCGKFLVAPKKED
ncbi:PTS sugar transporter subunit IIA [bacterium]|nr:PTS sugar transporter subunit IIA [bacterium]